MPTSMLERCSDRGRIPQDRKLLEEVAESHRFGFCHDTASVLLDQKNLERLRLPGRDRSGNRSTVGRPELIFVLQPLRCTYKSAKSRESGTLDGRPPQL